MKGDADKALGKLNDVPEEARGDLGYVLCRVKWAMKKDKIVDAAKMVIAAAPETMAQQDTDEWWRDRRTLSRKLLDMGEFQIAYDVVKDAATPGLEAYRADYAFMPGWIALRYLNDPATAAKHFADIDKGLSNPITLARANYWRARAAEAMGDARAARAFYEASAKYPTAYYGQLSRTKLGIEKVELRAPKADAATASDERVRAFDMLYAIGERDMPIKFAFDLAEECTDEAVLAALGEITFRRNDAKAMLQLGKTALGRGLALDHYAFPTIGIPEHRQVGTPEVEHGMIYAVARTESAFDQKVHSHADAVGLMQITPEAGKDTAKRFGMKYDWQRMMTGFRLQHPDGRGRTERADQRVQGFAHHDLCRLQRRPREGARLDQAARRSPPSRCRPGRLGGAHPVLRDAQLRAARGREPSGVPRAVRHRHLGTGDGEAGTGPRRRPRRKPAPTLRRPPPPRPRRARRSDKSLRILQKSLAPFGRAGTAMPTIWCGTETSCGGGLAAAFLGRIGATVPAAASPNAPRRDLPRRGACGDSATARAFGHRGGPARRCGVPQRHVVRSFPGRSETARGGGRRIAADAGGRGARTSSTTRASSTATAASACSARSLPSSPAAWRRRSGCSRARRTSRPTRRRSRARRRSMACRPR